MLNKNIKNLNKVLVKSNDNMFGGSTKRPPPPQPPSGVTMTPSPSSSSSTLLMLPTSSSSLSSTLRTTEHKTKLGGFSLRPSSSIPPPSPPVASAAASATATAATSQVKLTPLSAGAKLAGVISSVISSKSMSVSFPPHSTSSTSSLTSSASLSLSTASSASSLQATTAAALEKTKLLQQKRQQQQQQHYHHHHHYQHHTPQLRFRLLPGLKATPFFTILTFVCLETVLLSNVSNCAKTFYMHWNTSNSIFRIDNTDHIIDVNKGNLAFEFDQVHIICPVYEPGTFENETEKYIIYNVSKVEYETCRITNADPRVIAICDKPQKLMFFTITFRPFTPQPGGLEFLPGNDYYFISTSSKDDLYRRIGGRCSTNNMKVVFKVCCAPEDKNNRTNNNISGSSGGIGSGGGGGGGNNGIGSGNTGSSNSNTAIQQQHNNNININGGNIGGGGQLPSPKIPGIGGVGGGGIGGGMGGGMGGMGGNNGLGIGMNNGGGLMINGNSGTSINTNIDQFNRIPMQQPNNIGGMGGMGMGGIGGGGVNGQHQTGIRINNVPSSQQHPSQKNDDYDKHPNEVVKNEELTYNSAASSFYKMNRRRTFLTRGSKENSKITENDNKTTGKEKEKNLLILRKNLRFNNKSISEKFKSLLNVLLNTSNQFINFISNCNPIIITTTVLVILTNLFQYKLLSWRLRRRSFCKTKNQVINNEDVMRRYEKLNEKKNSSSLSLVDCINNETVESLSKTLNINSSTR